MEQNYLVHHGVKGMKWGVRRYQNENGTLTDAGKRRYDRMTDDQLRKDLHKQIKKARKAKNGWSNQWLWSNDIGEHSKAAKDKYLSDLRKHRESDAVKSANKKIAALDRKFENGKIGPDEYETSWEQIRKSVYNSSLDSSVTYSNKGKKYSMDFINSYGKDMNVGYLLDLGYNEETAKQLVNRVLRSNTKTLY